MTRLRAAAPVGLAVSVAIGLKLMFLGTTLAGITGSRLAILAGPGATVLVTLNTLRRLRWRFRAGEEKTRSLSASAGRH